MEQMIAASDRPVLVVDDDLDIREALTDTLEDRGFPVVTAENGVEALSVLRSAQPTPSVVLLDLMMPVMDGYRFLEEQRKDPALTSIPVAIISAVHSVDRDRLGNSTRVLGKPVEVPKLMNLIQDLRAGGPAS